jgi:drug/metabolite transporter (DMT)-like permease
VTSLRGIEAVFNNTRAWIGIILGLGLCGTGLAYVIYYYIVDNLGAVAAAGVTYIPPVVALLIGVFLVGDTIHPLGYAAMILTYQESPFCNSSVPDATFLSYNRKLWMTG